MLKRALKLIAWTFALMVLAGTAYTIYERVISEFRKDKESFVDPPPAATVYLFHAHWCGHCVEFRKSNVFVQTAAKMKTEVPAVAMVEIDVDRRRDLVKRYGITSFPTILGVVTKSQRTLEFEGDRYDAKQLEAFVRRVGALAS